MFTSPKFERTALLWGSQWWLPELAEPLAFADLAHAAELLAGHLAEEEKPVRLRLIYQPDGFAPVAVGCPQTNRATLAAVLSGEFPALDNPDYAWSHEPILPLGSEFTTLLYFEREPRLFPLVQALRQRGIFVQSAWPLATFLNGLPSELTDTGSVTVLAVGPDRAAAYRHPADGRRMALVWESSAAFGDLGRWLEAVFAKNPDEPVLIVGASEEFRKALGQMLPLGQRPGVRFLALADALAREVVLPRNHPAQLLPPTPALTAQRVAIAASFALFACAAWSALGYAQESLAWRTEDASRTSAKSELRAELGRLRDNAAEIAALRAELPPVAAVPPVAAFLRGLSTSIPPNVTVGSLHVSGAGFRLTGYEAPEAAAGSFEGWLRRFAPENGPIQITTPPEKSAAGQFALGGRFTR